MNRRNFLKASAAALILPAIVKAENIMRINPPGIIRNFNLCEYMDAVIGQGLVSALGIRSEYAWIPGLLLPYQRDIEDVLEIYSNNTLIWKKPGMGRLVPGSRLL